MLDTDLQALAERAVANGLYSSFAAWLTVYVEQLSAYGTVFFVKETGQILNSAEVLMQRKGKIYEFTCVAY